MQSTLSIGSAVGGFVIEAVVGRGATGVVYRARDAAGRTVAVKVLNAALAGDERFRRRFLREAKLAAELEHPGVVPVIATGEEAGVLYIAMAYVDGADLRTLIRDGRPLAPDRVLALLDGIADALDAAHAVGLVHRDVTPGNILIGEADGHETAYLGDFGLARHASTPTSLTGERSFVGTIDYIAPEQIRGDTLDGQADQYALACVLYECLTGAQPFARDSDIATVFAHLNERPADVASAAPDLPRALDGVLARGLAKEPVDRYPDCRSLIAAARAALRGEPAARGRRRIALGAGALLTGLAVAAAALLAVRDEPTVNGPRGVSTVAAPAPPVLPLRADGVALADPAGRRVLGQTSLEGVADLLVGGGAVWALLDQKSQLVRLDARTGRAGPPLDLPFAPGGMAATATDVWVAEAGGPGLVRVDARTGSIATRLSVEERAGAGTAIAVGDGSIWLGRGALVLRVDPGSGRVTARFATPIGADRLAAAPGAVWVASSVDGQLFEIDPATDRIVARPKLHGYVTDLAVGGPSAWVTVTPEDRVYQLNPDDGSVQASFAAGPGPESVAYVNGALVVANGRDGSLSRIDLATGERQSLPTGSSPMLVRANGGTAWIASVPAATTPAPLADGNEVRVSLPGDMLGMDPAVAGGPWNVQLAYQTCLRLQTYADAPGAAGRRLVPDGATANPSVSADGRTYVFEIRPGLRFAPPSGQPITAATFRSSIERALSPALGQEARAPSLVADIVGVGDFRAGRAAHVSGIVASGNRLSITIERPAGDFPARLALPFSCVVPPATPIVPDGVATPLASGGPYFVASHGPGRTVLERNPAYTGSRPRRPQRIVYETGIGTARAIALLDGGKIDYVPYDFDTTGPLNQGGPVDRRFGPDGTETAASGQRFYRSAAPGLDLLVFNTRRGLFRDVNLRRAVNAALDRPAIAAVWGEQPSDRYVPPGVLDSANGSAYPIDGPDVGRARRLAGGAGGGATLYFCGAPEGRRVVAIIRSNLAKIGIRVRPAPSLDCTLGHDPKIDAADLMLISPATPVADPAPFIEAALGREIGIGHGVLPPGWWDDASRRREIDAARALQGTARTEAYAGLQERLLTDDVPFAALGSWVAPEYVSPRLGCRLFQGAYNALDLGAACPQPTAG